MTSAALLDWEIKKAGPGEQVEPGAAKGAVLAPAEERLDGGGGVMLPWPDPAADRVGMAGKR